MGAWGAGAFDNDDAADWESEFADAYEAAGLTLIMDALAAAAEADGSDYLEAPAGSRAVAAAEVVVWINGHSIPESAYNQRLRDWIARTGPRPDGDLTDLARRAVERVASKNSELAELWGESGTPSWLSVIDELRVALDR
jgi:Domain of unknown function (DUF4259)